MWQFLLNNEPHAGLVLGQTKSKRYLRDEFKISKIENSVVLKLLKEIHWLFNKESILIKQPLSEILLNDLENDAL